MTGPIERPLLLALDLDGTLVKPREPLRPRVVAAVKQAAAAGVRVTIFTGRMYAGTRPFIEALGLDGPVVCYQGAVIADARSGRFEREIPLSNALALRAYETAKRHGYHVQFYRDDRFYTEAYDRYTDLYARTSGVEPVIVASLPEAFAGTDSTKVNIITDAQGAPAALELMDRTFAGAAYVTTSNPEFVEVLSAAVDKGRALAIVCRRYAIPPARVLAVGDSDNDVPLLRAAGFGVAMGSAPERLKREAHAVVGDVAADGVAEAVERFVLPRAYA